MQVLGILAATSLSFGLLLAPGPAPAPAVEPAGPSIANLTVDPGPFTVSGVTGSAVSTISVDVEDSRFTTGCWERAYGDGVVVGLTQTGGVVHEPRVFVSLRLVSGVRGAGTYRGEWRIGSTRGGTWTVTSVAWCIGGDYESVSVIDPRVALGVRRTVTVVGVNVPQVGVVRRPAVAAYGAPQDVILTFRSASGRPLGNRAMPVGEFSSGDCGLYQDGSYLRTTAPDGRLLVRTLRDLGRARTPRPYPWLPCVYFANPPSWLTPASTRLSLLWLVRRERFEHVTAQPASSVVARGGSVELRGSVAPAYRSTVVVRRLDRQGWVQVTQPVRVRASGRYTLVLPGTAAARGRHQYRVVAIGAPNPRQGDYPAGGPGFTWPSSSSLVPTASPVFLLTGR